MNIIDDKVKSVLFDKDGTLIDFPSIWVPWLKNIFEYISIELGLKLSYAELKEAFGVSSEYKVDPSGPLAISSLEESNTIISYILYRKGIPWDKAVVYARNGIQFANEKQDRSPSLKSIEGVEEALKLLKNKNINLGVLTADDTERAKIHLKRAGLLQYFDFVIGSDKVKNGKPNPDMAYLARDCFGIQLDETIVIGDTNADMLLGKSAGVKGTVGIVTGSEGTADHLQDGDNIIYHYHELFS